MQRLTTSLPSALTLLLTLSALTLQATLSAPCACAEEGKHKLEYKFKAGEVLRYVVDQRSSVRNTMEGTTQEAQTKTVSTKAWKVIDVMPNGEIEFINVVEKVKMQNKLPDRAAMTFDSTFEGDPPPGFEDASRAVGVPLSAIRMSPQGKVISREIKHHQPAADPHEQITFLLPEKEVAVGDSWLQPQDITVKLAEGGTKTIQARRKHTLKSVKNDVAVISTEFQVLSPTNPSIEGQIAHRMVKGEVRFDVKEGRIMAQQLKGDERVLGFAGPSSSMHLVTRLEEKILAGKTDVASRP